MSQDALPRVTLGDLTWPEIERLKPEVKVVIIPVGSTEQHGPHLCLATDAARAFGFSVRVARALYPRVLVAPVISVGISPHHMDFAGTITLRPETLINTIVDYVASLKQHGFDRFFIINAHGGNESTIGVASEVIRAQFGLRVPSVNYKVMTTDVTRKVIASGKIDHSGEWEVADAMFIAPEMVRADRLSQGGEARYPYVYTDIYGQFRVNYPLRWKDVTDSGAVGDARAATPEKGKTINDAALKRIVEFLEDYMSS